MKCFRVFENAWYNNNDQSLIITAALCVFHSCDSSTFGEGSILTATELIESKFLVPSSYKIGRKEGADVCKLVYGIN